MKFDYEHGVNGGEVVERRFDHPAAGWVDGVYHQRDVRISQGPHGDRPDGAGALAFTFDALREDTAPLDGDPATIGTFTYYSGTTLIVPLAARDWTVRLTVSNPGDRDVTVRPVVNDLAYYEAFTVHAGECLTHEFTAVLSKRQLELTFTWDRDAAAECGVDVSSPTTLMVHDVDIEALEHQPASNSRLFIIADSICQTYFDNERPQSGWGEQLFRYLFAGGQGVIARDAGGSAKQSRVIANEDGSLEIHNRALGARSSKSYMEEGRLNEVLRDLRPGDYLLFQMAPNDDTRKRPMRYEGPEHYLEYVDRYMVSVVDRGAHPMLVTPCSTCEFDPDGGIAQRFGVYGKLDMEYARDHGIPVCDLGGYSVALEARLGAQLAKAMHMKLDAGQYVNYPDGVDDDVHLNLLGARKNAERVARDFAAAFPESGFAYTPGSSREDVLRVGLPAPGGLTAQIEDDPGSQMIKLRWFEVDHADFYRVRRLDPDGGALMDAVTLNPWYYDAPAADWPDELRYEVTAWYEDLSSPASIIAMRHHFDLQTVVDRRITGVNIYEIDHQTFPGQTAFSLRFRARPDADRYTVVLVDDAGQRVELDHLQDSRVNGLHSYRVENAPGNVIVVEGANAAGERFASDPVPVPLP